MSKTENNSGLTSDLLKRIEEATKIIEDAKLALQDIGYQKEQIEDEDGEDNVIHGEFDGQNMKGDNGKIYPVDPNYASKSKLVEGQPLKLNITPEGRFLYKQFKPISKIKVIGKLIEDSGKYYVEVDGERYQILYSSFTYYQSKIGAKVGDELAIILPGDGRKASWAAIEAVIS